MLELRAHNAGSSRIVDAVGVVSRSLYDKLLRLELESLLTAAGGGALKLTARVAAVDDDDGGGGGNDWPLAIASFAAGSFEWRQETNESCQECETR